MPLHCREVPCLADQMIHNLVGLLPTHPEVPGLPVESGIHPDVLQMWGSGQVAGAAGSAEPKDSDVLGTRLEMGIGKERLSLGAREQNASPPVGNAPE